MITKEFLLSVGFKVIPHYTITDAVIYELGRGRHLSVGDVGTPNEMMFLCEALVSPEEVTNLICIHNYDYDGLLTENKVRSLLSWFEPKKVSVMTVLEAGSVADDKRARISGGFHIYFKSKELIRNGDYVRLASDQGVSQSYVVVDVVSGGELLAVSAKEAGYFAKFESRKSDFDPRSLLGLRVEVVTDPEVIKSIKESSLWC